MRACDCWQMVEVFNLFNTANLVQYGSNLANPTTFGQPGSRVSQVFGSGGPRALQLGARLLLISTYERARQKPGSSADCADCAELSR